VLGGVEREGQAGDTAADHQEVGRRRHGRGGYRHRPPGSTPPGRGGGRASCPAACTAERAYG
jgi:hypothetical protein